MSKSLNNYIGIEERADEMFGKVMSISDDLMWKYYELLTDVSVAELMDLKFRCDSGMDNPRDIKARLAKLIISDFHSRSDAEAAEEAFVKRFVKKEIPDEIEKRPIQLGQYKLVDLLVENQLASSRGEARRLIEQGGVKVDGEKITVTNKEIPIPPEGILIQVGKRNFLRFYIA
jgi:tyrosyl-tRNA synthetase